MNVQHDTNQYLEVGNYTVKLNADGTNTTRVGHYENTSELVFSDISVNDVAHSVVPQQIDLKVNCMQCHSTGPRAIRVAPD